MRPRNQSGYHIADHTRESFERYFRYGYQPGSFGTAVLCNNLFEAVMRADHVNRESLAHLVYWIEENAPAGSWGSREAVYGWLNKNEAYQAYQKKLTFDILSQGES